MMSRVSTRGEGTGHVGNGGTGHERESFLDHGKEGSTKEHISHVRVESRVAEMGQMGCRLPELGPRVCSGPVDQTNKDKLKLKEVHAIAATVQLFYPRLQCANKRNLRRGETNVTHEAVQSPVRLEKSAEDALDREGSTQVSNGIDNRGKFFNRFSVLEDYETEQGEGTDTLQYGAERGLSDSNGEELSEEVLGATVLEEAESIPSLVTANRKGSDEGDTIDESKQDTDAESNWDRLEEAEAQVDIAEDE